MQTLRSVSLALALAGLLASCATIPPAPNTLTATEKAAGWQLLFDGQTLHGWRGFRVATQPPPGWEVRDGTLKTVAKVNGAQLITERQFTDFELSWEWRIAVAGNNGVKYFVTEARPNAPGPEYQMLDDEKHPDGKKAIHQTGSFYDVLPPTTDQSRKTPGEWNASRIIVRGNHVEHWLNGTNVLTYELGSPEVKAGLAKSKFSRERGFGDKIAGPILLTYHQDECAFRNIKIRELP